MKKKLLILVLIMINIGFLNTLGYQTVSSTVNTANSFLRPRPSSSRTSTTLTLTQLNSFHTTVKSFVSNAKLQMYDIDTQFIDTQMAVIDTQLAGLTTKTFSDNYMFYYDIYEQLYSIYSLSIESKVIEGRGMWHRPFERNLNEVQTTLNEMVDMGINMLYVETFWLGRLIYTSNVEGTFQHGFTLQQNYGEYGNNLLLAFVEEGKKLGIEVHAWVENFFVGYGTSFTASPILANKPNWASYNYDGSIVQRSEVNYLWMDPANPEVQRYLKKIYSEIIETTDVASIHLDYIRYPVAKNVTSSSALNNLDTGYSDFAEAEFKQRYGLTGDLRQLVVSSPTIANQWKQYKTQVISDFVEGMYYTIKRINPKISLSIAIFGNVTNAINEKMQDWDSWTKDGFIEIIMPMSYYQSSLTVGTETKRLTDLVGKNAFSYAGLAPTYMGYNAHYNTTQIQASLSNGAQGTAFFASQFYMFSKNDYIATDKSYALEVQDVLTKGLFRNQAILPHGQVSQIVSRQLDYILDKATRIYVPRNAMTVENLTLMTTEFERIKALSMTTQEDLISLISAIKSFSPTTYSSGAARNRILEDRDYLIKILEIRNERYDIENRLALNLNPDGDIKKLESPSNVFVEEGKLRWSVSPSAKLYEIKATSNNQVTFITTSSSQYDLKTFSIGSWTFEVRALGDNVFFESSNYSTSVTHQIEPLYLTIPKNISINSGILSFDAVNHAVSYIVKINQSEISINQASLNLNNFNLQPGTYVISIKAKGDSQTIIDSDYSQTVTFIIERKLTPLETEVQDIVKNEVKELILLLLRKK
jgi:uncharacterized lipoprotein YddW (UPF0748 family)